MCKESDVLVASTACAVGTTIASNASSRKERSNRVFAALDQADSDGGQASVVKRTLVELHN